MKIGIMQPYYFPYIGYWQLMNAVDKYIVYDDVNYIKGGWINRNRLLNNGSPMYFNVKMANSSPNLLINQVLVADDDVYKGKQVKTLEMLYKKAPYFNECKDIIETIIMDKEQNLAKYLYNQIIKISRFLDMKTEIIMSSNITKNNLLKGKDKVIEIVKLLNGDTYINAAGGTELYAKEEFKQNGISLQFIKANEISYTQYKNEFVPNLSIIDVLMFNGKNGTKRLLSEYTLF